MTQVRLTITISELEMVKLRIVSARKHMPASRLAALWVKTKLASYAIVEPPYMETLELPFSNDMDEVPF